MAYDLKPCPFCGDIPEIEGAGAIWRGVKGYSDPQYYTLSHHCKHRDDTFGRVHISSRALTKTDMADLWNTRAETTAYRLLRHIFAENSALRLPEGLADDELDLIKELRG